MPLPPGYVEHPDNGAYMWNPQTNDVRPIEHVPPPAPTPAPQAQPQAQPQTQPQTQPQVASYGTVDLGAMAADKGHVFSKREKKIFIDFDKLANVGDRSERIVRVLPPWRADLAKPYVKFAIHRVPAMFVPNSGERQWFYVNCFDTEGGPGNCPICAARDAVLEHDAGNSKVEALGPRAQYVWQALDMGNLNEHFHQRLDAQGRPELLPDGNFAYDVVPGVIKSGASLWKSMVALFREHGDATHIETGYAMKLVREKTGPMDMNINYSAFNQAPSRLDDQLRPVLTNLFDLHHEFVRYKSEQEMNDIAQQIREYGGVANTAPQMGMVYESPQAQVTNVPATAPQAAPQVAPPATPPAAPQAAPAASQALPQVPPPPTATQAASPPPGRPQGYSLPSPSAPGGVPSASPGNGHRDVPPAPPPAPGMPEGFQPPDAPPPQVPPAPAEDPGLSLTGGQTPDEFERALRGDKGSGNPPF